MENKVIPVSVLAKYIKQIFEAEELLFNISVSGEVSGLKVVSGVAYFDLKDEFAVMPCVSFYAKEFVGIKNGDSVIAKGTPNFYIKGGKLSFNVRTITKAGLGELYLQYLQLKLKLEQEGLFDPVFKKSIPNNVGTIGVVTSETGAVIQDIINVAHRRNPYVNIVLFPAKVQGDGAIAQIMKGLDFFENYDVDVVIVARGGGSYEELNIFNDESLARRVFAFNKPIISAVGHETDYTIIDFVADLRAPTPSAAAELAVENINEKKYKLNNQIARFKTIMSNCLESKKYFIEKSSNALLYNIDYFQNNLKHYLSLKEVVLEKLNPDNILKLGYAKVQLNDLLVTSVKQVNKNDELLVHIKDGKIKTKVVE